MTSTLPREHRCLRRSSGTFPLFLVMALWTVAAFWAADSATAQDADAGPSPIVIDTGVNEEGGAGPPSEQSSIPKDALGVLRSLHWYFLVPFLLASVIAVWFAIERLVVLRRGRVIPRPFVERFLQHLEQGKLDAEEALQICEENGSPIAAIFAHGVRKWGKPSVEVEQAIIDGGERQVSQLREHLKILNGVATVTPLIGLLGTVTGMIMAFNDIARTNAMGQAQELAGGIAVALLTTFVGLSIAIPTLIIYMYLSGRVDSLVMEMDLSAQDVVQLISSEALSRQTVPTTHVHTRRTPGTSTVEKKTKRAV